MMNIWKCNSDSIRLASLTLLVLWTVPSAQGQTVPATSRLHLSLVDHVGLSEDLRLRLREEIESSLEQLDLALRITISEIHDLPAPSAEGATVWLHLWSSDGTFLKASADAMGAVRLSDGKRLQDAHVFIPVVVQTLTRSGESILDLTPLQLGRALGRVVAHEVVHAIAPRLPHSRQGLMRRGMTREFLLSSHPVRLDPRSARAVTRSLE